MTFHKIGEAGINRETLMMQKDVYLLASNFISREP